MLESNDLIVIAYPLGCINWIYFRRKFAESGASSIFVSLRASYDAIVDPRRGRAFTTEEHDRIRAMIAEGYDTRPFSDLVIDTEKAGFMATLAEMESRVRRLLAKGHA